MEPLTTACFSTLDGLSVFDAIDQGYPEIWAIDRGNGNGHCVSVIGYTSDNSLIIMDPEAVRPWAYNPSCSAAVRSVSVILMV